MSGILDKLGLYDFMGIWGPGVICVTYFNFTLHDLFLKIFTAFGLSAFEISSQYLLLLLCTVVSYVVGIVLNECGRLVADIFGLFRAESIQSQTIIPEKPCPIHIFKSIRFRYQSAIRDSIPDSEYHTFNFNTARIHLNYISNTSQSFTDTLHSIYAMSRSLSLIFMLHGCCSVLFILSGASLSLIVPLFDVSIGIIFFYRTYKYYYAWIQNVFIRYHLSRLSSNKSTSTCPDTGKSCAD